MSGVLQAFEGRLRDHFGKLAASKRAHGQPVFALEHDLSPAEVKILSAELARSLSTLRCMSTSTWLSWVVHGAEHGYTFDGQEYWYSFAAQTPNWTRYGNRGTLRDWYGTFASEFSGVRPNGTWGQHFNHISWPITNALLPRDLQVQLAESIYYVRYSLSRIALLAPEDVGKFIAQNTHYPSSRFRFFLLQHDLVGRIVHALLQGEDEQQNLFYQPTLKRVVADLNSRGNARAWLTDARKIYSKLQLQLPAQQSSFSLWRNSSSEEQVTESDELNLHGVLIKPEIAMRRGPSGKWKFTLRIPSFKTLTNFHPEYKEHLSGINFSIPAHGTAAFPAQNLLSGRTIEKSIRTWPPERTCLLSFSQSHQHFDRIVTQECQLLPATLWLFRLRDDGTGSYVVGQNVSAGESYVVVSRNPKLIAGIGQPAEIECQGVVAVTLDLDAVVSEATKQQLSVVGIGFLATLRIEPAGLLPRQWHADGSCEWLYTETPCLAISKDHEFDAYQFSIDSGTIQSFPVPRDTPGPVYFMIEGLTVGKHDVTVATRVRLPDPTGAIYQTTRSFNLSVFIRPPTPWSPGKLDVPAMLVDIAPPKPTIDDFLNNRLDVRAEGDPARTATCSLVLTDGMGEKLSSNEIFKHALPITTDAWRHALAQFLTKQTDERTYLEAAGGYVKIDAGDIGEHRVMLLHEPKPLRWIQSKTKSTVVLRLVNDGEDRSPGVERRNFSHPLESILLTPEEAGSGIDVSTVDGIFVANGADQRQAVIATCSSVGKRFDWLGATIDKEELRKVRDPNRLIDAYALWKQARPCSPISHVRQSDVCAHIHRHLLAVLCGVPWILREKNLDKSHLPNRWNDLETDIAPVTYAIALVKKWNSARRLQAVDLESIHREITSSLLQCQDSRAIHSAWQIALDPVLFFNETGRLQLTGTDATFCTILRGARLLICCAEHQREDVA